ncbi:TIGR02281 family clan AA aspartic protease [Pseudanabaena sp. ABRG5-3]|uniref:retropepsin-like aspartic protease family protein n=1 Tax=Pseudanabaena sp. ABRG5-3 TaxID=685565 RepID=UPI000DC6F8F7|nr:retropepsin-like aspartic protease [Pseudanabaena sp. ABRG5-3]BBC23297.1 aspartyl protease [Pseudanabaena sp. ABRG5-3]
MSKINLATITLIVSSLIGMSDLFVNKFNFVNQANAQDLDCFMVNSKGRRIDLSGLCSSSQNETVRIPIKRRMRGIPIVEVTFNGNRVYEMMLDTGASRTLITAEMAQTLNVVPDTSEEFDIADGSKVSFPIGKVKSISLGSLKVQMMPVPIATKANMGLLGHDFFGNLDIKIGRNVIELSPRRSL